MHGATGLERWGREERTLGRDRLCANDCANELLHLLYGVHCAWKFYTVFSNFLNNFNKSIIIHIFELRGQVRTLKHLTVMGGGGKVWGWDRLCL